MRKPTFARPVWRAGVGFLLFFACGGTYPTVEEQAEATRIVWRDTFKMRARPPSVEWVFQDRLDCGEGRTFNLTYQVIQNGRYVNQTQCVYGAFLWAAYTIKVAWPADATFSSTAFAHELWHAALEWSRVDETRCDHCDPGFAPGGVVSQANEALKARGL